MKPGDQIQDYTILAQIALGGFGTVWRAQHRHHGALAAIKILHGYLISSDVLVKRFEREARAIALMRHPNIVELLDAGRLEDGRPYLIMELLEGQDLGAHITRRGTLLARESLAILEQLGAALEAAHVNGIVHRDLKASNVFLSERDGGLRVVLFDFGIAKLLGRDSANLTRSSSLVGSPACMSPEQILGQEVDPRTDVYALGSLTYQMLVGHPPFSGASPTAILTMHLDDYPPYPSLHGDVSPAFDPVIMKAMSKEPERRYQNVSTFVEAFRAAVEQTNEAPPTARVETGVQAPTVPALVLYIDVGAEPQALEDPEDPLLDDMESIIPRAAESLEDRGYLVAYERGTSALFVRVFTAERLREPEIRRAEVLAAAQLFEELQGRPQRDADVRLRMYLHTGDVVVDGDDVESLLPLDATDWTPALYKSGVFAADDVLSDLDLSGDSAPAALIQRLMPQSDTDQDEREN